MGYGIRKSKVKGIQHGVQSFTTSGVFTVPTGVRKIRVFLVGGGGGSGRGWFYTSSSRGGSSGGGGGGYTKTTNYISVAKGQQLAVTVAPRSNNGGDGNASYVKYNNEYLVDIDGAQAIAYGGSASPNISAYNIGYGANGGSGGGAGARYSSSSTAASGAGGSDGNRGGDGSGIGWSLGGTGQGRTTREWESPTGTLFAKGGDGGHASQTIYRPGTATHGTDGLGNGAGGCDAGSSTEAAAMTFHGGSGYVAIEY